MSATLSFSDTSDPGFDLLSFELRDEMSRLFSLSLDVQSTHHNIELSSLVGQRVVFEPDAGELLPRVTGIVRAVEVTSTETTGVTRYRLEVVPPLWLATRRSNHRIFQDRSVVQIVQDVLADYAGRIAAPALHLHRSYEPRSYTTQYGESDHDFVFRMLAEEGIATFFDHAAESRWSLVDQTDHLTPEHDEVIPYNEPGLGNEPPVPAVLHASVSGEIDSSAVAVHDYDHLNPSFSIQARATADGAELFIQEGDLEIYDVDTGEALEPPGCVRPLRNAMTGRRLCRIVGRWRGWLPSCSACSRRGCSSTPSAARSTRTGTTSSCSCRSARSPTSSR